MLESNGLDGYYTPRQITDHYAATYRVSVELISRVADRLGVTVWVLGRRVIAETNLGLIEISLQAMGKSRVPPELKPHMPKQCKPKMAKLVQIELEKFNREHPELRESEPVSPDPVSEVTG
jgi:hypothetical protein